MSSSTVARKLIKNHLTHLRRSKNKDEKLHRNAVASASKWTEQRCNSGGVEDLDDGSKLIVRKNAASLTSVVTATASKSVLELLKSSDLQLSLGTVFRMAWSLWPLRARSITTFVLLLVFSLLAIPLRPVNFC